MKNQNKSDPMKCQNQRAVQSRANEEEPKTRERSNQELAKNKRLRLPIFEFI
jgi:hypothetical protein